MKEKDIFGMSKKEWARLKVVKKVIEKQMTQRKAAFILGLSERQIKRIVKRVWREGIGGIAHRSRNRPSFRKIPEQLKEKVVSLYQETYSDFGPTLTNEKLFVLCRQVKRAAVPLKHPYASQNAYQAT
ncbi:helix-turn-helix domain-containing protein [bacterium]|nr:helix-turn-helix domain-containing protein [bacterium]